MPFASKRQARYLFARLPNVARKMVNDSGRKHPIKGLPEKARRRRRRG